MFFSLEDVNENALPNAVPMEFYNWVNSLKPVFMSVFFFCARKFHLLDARKNFDTMLFPKGNLIDEHANYLFIIFFFSLYARQDMYKL